VFSRPSVKTIATYLVCRLMVGVVADQTRVRRSRVGHGCLLDHAFQDMDVNRTFQDLDLLVDGRRRRRRNFLFSGIRVLLCTVRVLCRYSVLYDISYDGIQYNLYSHVCLLCTFKSEIRNSNKKRETSNHRSSSK
jgi:hypothetical protein